MGHFLKPKMPPRRQPVILSGRFWRAGHRPLGVVGMVWGTGPPSRTPLSVLDLGMLCCPFSRVLLGQVGLLPRNAGLLSTCLSAWAPGMPDEPWGVRGAGKRRETQPCTPLQRPRMRQQAQCCRVGEARAVSPHHAHIYRGGGQGTGSARAGARGSNPVPRDSPALPEEPSRTAMALIQWLPNAHDRKPFLAEPLLALGAEEHSLGTQSSCPGLKRASGCPGLRTVASVWRVR